MIEKVADGLDAQALERLLVRRVDAEMVRELVRRLHQGMIPDRIFVDFLVQHRTVSSVNVTVVH